MIETNRKDEPETCQTPYRLLVSIRQHARRLAISPPVVAAIAYTIFALYTFYHFSVLLVSLYRLDYSILPISFVHFMVWLLYAIGAFLYSTKTNAFNYHNIKEACILLSLFLIWQMSLAAVFKLLSRMLLPSILAIKTDEIFTGDMVLMLGRVAAELPLLFAGYFLFKGIFYIYLNKDSRKKLLAFKITHVLHPKNNGISYPMHIVKDIRSGKHIPILEKDRYLHTLVDGTTGTGKTSSTILTAIKDDLNTRCIAEDKQKECLKWLETEGKIKLPHKSCRGFSIHDFMPVPMESQLEPARNAPGEGKGMPATLEGISMQYPVCGITVLAPDDSLTDDVCKLCEAREVPYNRVDPTRDINGNRKANFIGINPFYLPGGLGEEDLNQLVVKKAVIFADVMQVITDLKGKADSYFTGLNRQLIANLAILVMITVPILKQRHATPEDVQELVNDFDQLGAYVDALERYDHNRSQYTFIVKYIRFDLLGKGRVKMEDQSRGTRNIINEFLLMPENKETFCVQESLDFDQILKRGEVTVCNYHLASGDTNAIAYGLFFLLSFNNAVLSRPGTERSRLPHFFYLDEMPVLIHPSLEKNFSLFRKFKVAMFVAIQTLDQMEKNEITKYLKGVILGCAHIIVFGRASLSDMKAFSSMAGVHDEVEEQVSTSETALSSLDPQLSYSSRETVTQKNKVEEIDIRLKDFQEVTFFTAQQGRPLPVMHGKVDFLKQKDWSRIKRADITFETEETAGTASEELAESLANRQQPLPDTPVSLYITNIRVDENLEEKETNTTEETEGSFTYEDL